MLTALSDLKNRKLVVKGAGSAKILAFELAAVANHLYQGFKESGKHDFAMEFIETLRAVIQDEEIMETPMSEGTIAVVKEESGATA